MASTMVHIQILSDFLLAQTSQVVTPHLLVSHTSPELHCSWVADRSLGGTPASHTLVVSLWWLHGKIQKYVAHLKCIDQSLQFVIQVCFRFSNESHLILWKWAERMAYNLCPDLPSGWISLTAHGPFRSKSTDTPLWLRFYYHPRILSLQKWFVSNRSVGQLVLALPDWERMANELRLDWPWQSLPLMVLGRLHSVWTDTSAWPYQTPRWLCDYFPVQLPPVALPWPGSVWHWTQR